MRKEARTEAVPEGALQAEGTVYARHRRRAQVENLVYQIELMNIDKMPRIEYSQHKTLPPSARCGSGLVVLVQSGPHKSVRYRGACWL